MRQVLTLLLLAAMGLWGGQGGPVEPAPAETADPYAWQQDYEASQRYATLADFCHQPLDELPRELLDSLKLVEREERDYYGENSHWGVWSTYTAPGLTIHTSAPTASYMEYLEGLFRETGSVWVGGEETYETEEGFLAGTRGEEGREWVLGVEITDPAYATLEGLRVGLTLEEAEALGYPLSQTAGFGGGLTGNMLDVTVENGLVTGLRGTFGIGRYIGKFWEM